jgi:hypothetical protein
MTKSFWMAASLLTISALACGGNTTSGTGGGSGNSSLDGAWDIAFTGGPYQTGKLTVAGGTGILSLDGDRCGGHEGVSITLDSSGTSGAGSDDCGGQFNVAKSGAAISAFGGIGGSWTYGSSPATCVMTIAGSQFNGSCTRGEEVDDFLVGSISGTLSTDGNSLSGQTSEDDSNVQFAAARR